MALCKVIFFQPVANFINAPLTDWFASHLHKLHMQDVEKNKLLSCSLQLCIMKITLIQ